MAFELVVNAFLEICSTFFNRFKIKFGNLTSKRRDLDHKYFSWKFNFNFFLKLLLVNSVYL